MIVGTRLLAQTQGAPQDVVGKLSRGIDVQHAMGVARLESRPPFHEFRLLAPGSSSLGLSGRRKLSRPSAGGVVTIMLPVIIVFLVLHLRVPTFSEQEGDRIFELAS